jgi:23S rRNA (adenine-N6)-dimethyltransferase
MRCIFVPKTIGCLGVSQNYLTSSALIRRIIRLSSIGPNDFVVEIGAGKGHLTQSLCEACGRIIAIELDKKLYARLAEKFSAVPGAQILCADFLKWSLPKARYKVFANIPFNRTTEIVKKLFLSGDSPAEAWLVLEKGAAKRFLGAPRESSLSLLLKPLYDAEIVYHFSREDFHPAPSVDAVLLHFKKKQNPDIEPGSYSKYRRFITDCMENRGAGIRKYLTKKQISTALRLEKLSTDITTGDTLYIQWLCLFRCYLKFGKPTG